MKSVEIFQKVSSKRAPISLSATADVETVDILKIQAHMWLNELCLVFEIKPEH